MSVQTVIRGDARKLARRFEPHGPTVVITDPDWSNRGLVRSTLKHLVGKVSHVVIQVGAFTDPRVLQTVPNHWPFWRTCWLPGSRPGIASDVALVFGLPRHADGGRVAPAECPPSDGRDQVRWLVRWFSRPGETVLDPFCGVGTTLLAAQEHHRDAIGWDIERALCEQAQLDLRQPQLCDTQAGAGA